LARWLRTLGYDTAYEEHVADADLVRRALAEKRIILTRDRDLVREWELEGVVLLQSERPLRQLREVAAALGLQGPRRLFGRCRLCNEPLVDVARDRVRGRVPRGVLERHDRFLECPACERVYWEGSHAERMRRVVEEIFG
ncbi:MAG: Mut7-C RNAse domain-containing protein, partial [Gemmatimonadota bacterium]